MCQLRVFSSTGKHILLWSTHYKYFWTCSWSSCDEWDDVFALCSMFHALLDFVSFRFIFICFCVLFCCVSCSISFYFVSFCFVLCRFISFCLLCSVSFRFDLFCFISLYFVVWLFYLVLFCFVSSESFKNFPNVCTDRLHVFVMVESSVRSEKW